MLKGLSEVISNEFLLAFLAASGGIARVITGTTPIRTKTSFCGEAVRVMFCAMPVGIMSAMYVATICKEPTVSYAVSFTAGVISLNIVRFISTPEGFKAVKDILIRLLTGGKK